MRDEVVGEHRQRIEVGERRDAGARQVGGGDLRPLEERDLELVVARDVGERLPPPEAPRQRDGSAAGGVGDGGEAPVVLGDDMRPEVAQRPANSPISSCSGSWPTIRATVSALISASSAAVQRPVA